MKVRCTNSNLWNQSVDVYGTVYVVDSTGHTETSDDHAQILTRGRDWHIVQTDVGQSVSSTPALDQKTLQSKSGTEIIKIARSQGISVINKSKAVLINEIIAKLGTTQGGDVVAPTKE